MTGVTLQRGAQQAADLIRRAKYVAVLTGAGISTPSGIPDFRSVKSGLWTKNDPMTVASLSAFNSHPEIFFNWLRPLAEKIFRAAPNAAHAGLAKMEDAGWIKVIVTQNIDGLHQAAGSVNVLEIHGSTRVLTCQRCNNKYPFDHFYNDFVNHNVIPRCKNCMIPLKPDIILFEEMLPMNAWAQAQAHFEKADLALVIGSSLEVIPAAMLPGYSLDNGACLIINTLSPTPFDAEASLLLPFDVVDMIPAISEYLTN